MKKLFAVFMIAGLATFAACSNSQETSQEAATATENAVNEAAATEATAPEAAEATTPEATTSTTDSTAAPVEATPSNE
ncbi:MAG: hypothetical protein LC117_09365 [Bacteroidia bacterium]|nr:hypothetical protein [Bacteroidia bacterium]MCZ2278121.1 hypothetical protein [Bacteroidia bacterium]